MKRLRSISGIVAALLVTVLVAACGGGAQQQSTQPAPAGNTSSTPAPAEKPKGPQKPKILTVGYGAEPGNMLPHASGGEPSILKNTFDTLVRRADDLKLVPGLAERWETSANGLTWTFHLRKGVKFHNGEPFNAESVKWTFDKDVMAEKSIVRTQFTTVTEVKVVDDYTITFTTKNPFPLLTNYLSSSFYVMPPKYYQEVGAEGFSKKPVGTGPFKFAEWVKNERIVLEANADYFGGKPKLDKVIFRPIPETATRLAELLAGGVDIITQVPPEHVDTIKKSSNAKVEMRDSVRVVYMGLRTDQKPFDDVRVRKAVNMAINRQEMLNSVLSGQGYLTPGPLSPLVWGYDKDVKGYDYDLTKAKQLLTEAGYANGFEVTLETPNGRYLKDKEVSEWVSGQLSKLNIKVNVKPFEWGQYLEKYRGHTFGTMYVLGWGGTAYDADFVFSNLFHSSNFRAYYKNPDVDKKIDAARDMIDENQRMAAYKELQKIVVDEAAWIYLYGQIDAWGLSKRVKWTPGLTEYLWLQPADVE